MDVDESKAPRSHPKPHLKRPQYKTELFHGDEGRWTIIRVTEEAVAQAYSEYDAKRLIADLEAADNVRDE